MAREASSLNLKSSWPSTTLCVEERVAQAEQQIQRYEVTRYAGVSIERL